MKLFRDFKKGYPLTLTLTLGNPNPNPNPNPRQLLQIEQYCKQYCRQSFFFTSEI